VNQARALAKAKLAQMRGPGTETVKKHWKYDQAAFYDGLKTLNLATSFTGSYDVTVTVKCQKDGPDDHRFRFDVNLVL
jgi:hypothetical protein